MSEAEKLKGPSDHPPKRRAKRLGKSGEQPRPAILDEIAGHNPASNDIDDLKAVQDIATAQGEEANSVVAEDSHPPESEPQRAKNSDTFAIGPRNGGGDGGGNPPESAPEVFSVSQDVLDAIDELAVDRGINGITTVEFSNDYKEKASTRRDILSSIRVLGLHALQNDPRLGALEEEAKALEKIIQETDKSDEQHRELLARFSQLTKRFYSLEEDYRSFGMNFKNMCRIAGYDNELEFLTRGNKPAVLVDVGGGNSNLLRVAKDKYREVRLVMREANALTNETSKRRSPIAIAREMRASLQGYFQKGTDRYGHYHLLDLAPPFCRKMLQKGMNGIPLDVCQDPRAVLSTLLSPPHFDSRSPAPHPLLPNSADFINMQLTADRVADFDLSLENGRLLARLDKETDFIVATMAPISNMGNNQTANANVPCLPFYDPYAKDPRKDMMGNRKDAILHMLAFLNYKGYRVSRVGEYPSHEVVSIHSIVEPVSVLLAQYREDLERLAKTYEDPSLRQLCRDVLSGKYPDDEMICLPEENRLIYFAGKITNPLDGKKVLDHFNNKEEAEELRLLWQQLEGQKKA